MDFSSTCRTCLEYKNAEHSVNVTGKCYLNNSVKDIIIMLVPQMAQTLMDTDFICENCFNVLENCVIFIEKCLETEEILKTQRDIVKLNDADNAEVAPLLPVEKFDVEIESDLEGDLVEDYFVTNEDTHENHAEEEHNYSTNYTNTSISASADIISEHNRAITLENSNGVIIQGFINKLAQSGINILQVSKNPDANISSTKKRILLLGSNIPNAAYKCPKCAKLLQNKNKYNTHIRNCNWNPTKREDDEVMKCLHCSNSIKRKHMELHLIRHEQRAEKRRSKRALEKERKECEKQILQCITCSERFTSAEDYQIHLEIHPPYICEQCGKGFIQRSSLSAHKYTHQPPNSFICEICGKGYKDMNKLRVHLQNHENRKFKCHICGKDFKLKVRLMRHIKYVHKTGFTIQCSHCGKLFKNKTNHNAHVRLVHMKMKPFVCKICDKTFGRSDYLRRHTARHTGKPNDSNDMRRLHIRRNNSNNETVPLPCKFCGKKFLGKPKLKLHLETHVKICRFPCQFCPLTFARKHICKKHEKLHKGLEGFFRCNICWRRLTSKEDLDAHIQTKHTNPRYICNTCGKRFHRTYLLDHHHLLEHRTPEDTEKAKKIVYESLLEVDAVKQTEDI